MAAKLNLTTSSDPRLGTARSRFSVTLLLDAVRLNYETFDQSLIALADAVEDTKTSRLFLVHKEGTQNRNAAEKRVAISVANEKTFKSCPPTNT